MANPIPHLPFTVAVARQVVELLEDLCRQALVEDHGLSSEGAADRLQRELDYYGSLRLEDHSVNDLYTRVVLSLANRDMMWSVIFGGAGMFESTYNAYAALLFNFSPGEVVAAYDDRTELLLPRLVQARGLDGESAERQLTNPKALFPLFARGILESAAFFATFDDIEQFAAMVRSRIAAGRDSVADLPNAFRFSGFRYRLASDLLKEIGVREVGKPDRHVRGGLAAIGWCAEDAPDETVQRVLWDAWQILGERYPPVSVDKLLFLIGSGRFEMVEPGYKCRPRFEEFKRRLALLRGQ